MSARPVPRSAPRRPLPLRRADQPLDTSPRTPRTAAASRSRRVGKIEMFRVLRSLASENHQVTCSLSFSPLRLRPHARVGVAPKRRVRPRSRRNDRIEPASRPQRPRPRTRPQRLPPDGPAGAISGWSGEALVLLRRRCFPCRDRRESKIDRTDERGPISARYSPQSVAEQFCSSEPDVQVTPRPSAFIKWRCIGPARSTSHLRLLLNDRTRERRFDSNPP
jgi:hypothetical protein